MSTTTDSFDEFETYLNTTRRMSESQPSTPLRALLGETSPSPTYLQTDRSLSVESKESLCLSDAEREADEFVRQQQTNQNQSTPLGMMKHEDSKQFESTNSEYKQTVLCEHETWSSSTLNDNTVDDADSASSTALSCNDITMESLLRTNDFYVETTSNTLSQINENDDSINSHGDNLLYYNTRDLMSKKREIRRQLSDQPKQNVHRREKNQKNRLQQRYSLAIEDFKILRSNLTENMEKNLQRTEQLSLKQKTLEQYRSVDNILRHNFDINVGRTHSDVAYRNPPQLNRYSSQERIHKRHSGMNFDEEYLHTRGIDRLFTNNNYDPTYKRSASPLSVEMQREHQSNLRDQAARSNFERYLRGSINTPPSNTTDHHMFHNNNNLTQPSPLDVDVGYGGSGSTSPREEILMPSDQLSSRSGSVNSHHSRSSSALASVDSGVRMSFVGQHNSLVVVAIDFGTTFSGYAFSFTRDSNSIHMMRRWEGGDPGMTNQKTPTTLLLKPDGSFHSFGFGARDFYHDLDASEARKWLYFDKFKMSLHSSEDLHAGLEIKAANGKLYPALKVFSHALKFFKQHVLAELSDQSTAKLSEEDITWVLTVPAIWRQPAKQFMRTAAYEAGIASMDHPDRLLIALEPEAASIFCRKLRIRDCVIEDDLKAKAGDDTLISEDFAGTTQYIVVDCGGGTVDLTVHELDVTQGTLKELHKGTGGPCGATGVDREFEKLLKKVFDSDFIDKFKVKRPAAWVDLMISFEAKKRTARHDNDSPLNLSLPFSFIEYHKKHRKCSVETAIKKNKNPDIKWSSQGMLRFSATIMQQMFEPVVNGIISHIQHLLKKVSLKHVEHLFLVGGFAESPLLQHSIRQALEGRVRVIIPNDVGLAILKGAVLFGLDPTVVRVRRSAYTYGVGVLNKFDSEKHEQTKRVVKDGIVWCKDIFDTFVRVDESVGLGDRVTRSYAPARSKQKSTVINIYCTEKLEVLYTTDKGVTRCGKLRIEMPDVNLEDIPIEKRGKPRELQASMIFGDTEIKVSAVDVLSGRAARANIDFLNY